MILGVWNLQVYPSRNSARGIKMTDVISVHPADVWFLTELHAGWEMDGHTLCFSQPRTVADGTRRLSAIASRWIVEPVLGPNNPAERWVCLAHLTDPLTGARVLAVSSVLPWRGLAHGERQFQGRDMTYTKAFHYVLRYTVQRITDELRPGEEVIWGGDFNQALSGRDYVGTNHGRAELLRALDQFGLQAVTAALPAMIPTHAAIDHIWVPRGWSIHRVPAVIRPTYEQKRLSDHALYLVEAQPR